MPRPRCCRRVAGRPVAVVFKPAGVPVRDLEEVVLTLDEFEAIRLADLNGLYQEPAASRMNISRPTFSRLIESARRKVAEALVHGKVLRIEGGPILPDPHRRCAECSEEWEGSGVCPRCEERARAEQPPAGEVPARRGRCRRRGQSQA